MTYSDIIALLVGRIERGVTQRTQIGRATSARVMSHRLSILGMPPISPTITFSTYHDFREP